MYMPTNTSRSMLEKAKRPGDLRRSTFSWCRSARISASSAARDRKRPAKAHQISLQRSIIAASINRFARAYQPTLVFGRDRLTSYGVTFHSYTEPHLATDNELVRNILLALLSSLAKVEAQKISERTKAGMARAKAKGIKIGRPRLRIELRQKIAKRAAEGQTPYAIAKALGVDRHTVTKYAG